MARQCIYTFMYIYIQCNLDYPECSGQGKNVRLIESSDDRVYTRKPTFFYMYSYLHDIYIYIINDTQINN